MAVSLQDVQNQVPTLHVSLSRVGVTNVEKVIRIDAGGHETLYSACLDSFVDLGPRQKGAHMSRFEEVVNEAIGEVDDVILSGTSHSAVISVGGFLGLGARLVQVPLSDIRWNAERERMMLPGATKEQLQSRPAFDYNTLRRG